MYLVCHIFRWYKCTGTTIHVGCAITKHVWDWWSCLRHLCLLWKIPCSFLAGEAGTYIYSMSKSPNDGIEKGSKAALLWASFHPRASKHLYSTLVQEKKYRHYHQITHHFYQHNFTMYQWRLDPPIQYVHASMGGSCNMPYSILMLYHWCYTRTTRAISFRGTERSWCGWSGNNQIDKWQKERTCIMLNVCVYPLSNW